LQGRRKKAASLPALICYLQKLQTPVIPGFVKNTLVSAIASGIFEVIWHVGYSAIS